MLLDAHCHLDFVENAAELAAELGKLQVGGLSCTVQPADFPLVAAELAPFENITVGLGLHPWWVDGSAEQLEEFERHFPAAKFIGEVGLDFSPKHEATRQAQLVAFTHIARLCAGSGQTLSIHAVNAATEALDILEKTSTAASCKCIFHFFKGNEADLRRAIKLGAHFSINPRQLEGKRGRHLIGLMPPERLFVETDRPLMNSGKVKAAELAAAHRESLVKTSQALEALLQAA